LQHDPPCISVWVRLNLTSLPPAAAISTSVWQTSSAPSSGSPS
jgi:hypothetical protein